MMDMNKNKEVDKLKRQLLAEQKLKLEAFNKLEALRNDFKWEEYFERNDDKQSMAAYWKKRYQEASSQLQATTDENMQLQVHLER
ncbi:hypothetical protein T484DRAFT_3445721 [Baffinella frigidus]|nr:hypothetical protein T484DRAFT_3445721 [Cryptophyta sp. CCMP2293]